MTESRTVVVTGGASGIGEATVRAFAAAGDRVVIADIQEENGKRVAADLSDAGYPVRFVPLDVTDEQSVIDLQTTVGQSDGAIDILVNSAGLLQNAVSASGMDMEEHDRIWQVNYRGTFLCCRHFGKAMVGRGRGVIINLGSINSFRTLPLPAYCPGKAAIKTLTEMLAVDYGAAGVRVNAVAPGYTLTPNLAARIESGHRDQSAMEKCTALGIMVTPQDIADAILFLCSPAARAITGVTLPIDAGWMPAVTYKSYPSPVADRS